MSQLKIALLHRDNWYRHKRIDGQFAYPVPEMRWTHFVVDKPFLFNLNTVKHFDLVWLDEGKYKGEYLFTPRKGADRPLPVVCHFLYTTLNQHIYQSRVDRANNNADLVLLDYEQIPQFEAAVNCPVDRCAYSVNEKYYYPRGKKDIDVGFYAIWRYNPERIHLDAWLEDFCNRKGYVYGSNRGHILRDEYPELLSRSKVVIHLNRTPTTRPARIFDVAASGAVLLSNPMPEVSGEQWIDSEHYLSFETPTSLYKESNVSSVKEFDDKDCQEIISGLEYLLDGGEWGRIAQSAYEYVIKNHTWAVRAKQLRGTFEKWLMM